MTAEFALHAVDEPEPWDQRPDEPSAAYHAFTIYRNFGPKRSYAATARTMGLTAPRISQLSTQFDWQTRAEGWDFYMDRIFQAELAERQRILAKEQFQMASNALTALNAPVHALMTKMETDPEGTLAEFGAKDLAKLMRIAQDSIRLMPQMMSSQRLALGQPTDITERTETQNVNYNDAERIGDILDVLHEAGVLDAFTGEGQAGEVIDAEVVELDDGGAVPKTDSLPDSPK